MKSTVNSSSSAVNLSGLKEISANARPGQRLALVDKPFLLLFGVILAVSLDPFLLRLDYQSTYRHLTLILFAGLCGLRVVAGGPKSRFLAEVLAAHRKNRAAFVFGFICFAGSALARFRGIEATFLNLGVCTLAFPWLCAWITSSKSRRALLIWLTSIIICAASLMVAYQLLNARGFPVFHNTEHLVVAPLVVACMFRRGLAIRLIGVSIVALSVFWATKLTGLVILAFAGVASAVAEGAWALLRSSLMRAIHWLAILLVAAMAGLAFYFLITLQSDQLASGNTDYRLHTYGLMFDRFLSSPWWGNFYTESAVLEFDLFEVYAGTQMLPTHNDLLDILANGGVLGFMLFAAAICLPLRRAWIAGRQLHSDVKIQRMLLVFAAIGASGIAVAAFNPILNSPNQAWLIWLALAVASSGSRYANTSGA